MKADLSEVTFDEIFNILKRSFRLRLNDSLTYFSTTPPIKRLASFIKVSEQIGSAILTQPLNKAYEQQWTDFCNKRLNNLEPRAVRYLCTMRPEIATDKNFLIYLQHNPGYLRGNSLKGLVRAAHLKWSHFKKTSLLEKVSGFIQNYDGPDRILIKWKENLDMILSQKAPELFASEMVKDNKTIKSHTEYWALDAQSEFFHEAITKAVIVCRAQIRNDINKCNYLFSELFSYKAWQVSSFKEEIGKTILDKFMDNDTVRERLQVFIQRDDRLGDPRLPINNLNWIGIEDEARSRIIQWLSMLNIVFFFEHVLPKGRDPHGRKDFWLRYFNRFKAARSLLCSRDEVRLQTTLTKDKEKVGYFGRIRGGINSAFLLDFGALIVVEFSKLGRCYFYEEKEFKQRFPDFWTDKVFDENKLKNQRLPEERRIVHRNSVNVKWRNDATKVLAIYGIRQ